jgi:hypothetical protein
VKLLGHKIVAGDKESIIVLKFENLRLTNHEDGEDADDDHHDGLLDHHGAEACQALVLGLLG